MKYKIFLLLLLTFCVFVNPDYAYAQNFTVEFGKEETVYDQSITACTVDDMPDFPARALVDKDGNVQLYSTNSFQTIRMVGNNLTDLKRDCHSVFSSHQNPEPRSYDTKEYLISPYTIDGNTIYSLVHTEYHGEQFNNCNAPDLDGGNNQNCWWTSINLAKSIDAGYTFTHSTPPTHNIGNTSIDFDPNNTLMHKGLLQPSNIIKRGEYYYANLDVLTPIVAANENRRVCTMRTNNLEDPASWRLWDGSGWNISPRGVPATGNCANTSGLDFDLHFSSYFDKYIATGARKPSPLYGNNDLMIQTSTDLISYRDYWFTGPKFGERYYQTFLQPGAETRNFEDIGRSPWMYYITCNSTVADCSDRIGPSPRVLNRVRVRFNKPEDVGKYDVLDLGFNEYNGKKALDSSFYVNDGTVSGNAGFVQSGDTKFLRFRDNTGKVTVANSGSLSLKNNITITARIKTGQAPTGPVTIVSKIEGGKRNYGLYIIESGRLKLNIMDGAVVTASKSNSSINDGQWHDVQVSFALSGKVTYTIDGKLDNTTTQLGKLSDGVNTGNLEIGTSFVGDIDRLTIYNYVLPAPTPNTTNPTPTPSIAPVVYNDSDLDKNGVVNNVDVSIFMVDYGKVGLPGFTLSDINKDGKVNIFDYNILVVNFGK